MKKTFLVTSLILISLFFPTISNAQLDQRCFTAKECEDQRGGSVDGWVQNPESQSACGDTIKKDGADTKVGFCLPITTTATKIAFGGRREFANLGEFLQYMYKYAILIAGILAVIMLIKAGFTWATSGGAQDKVKEAMDEIKRSVIGLLIILFSYAILANINPYLVQLRLPQVWMIKTQQLSTNFCSDLNKDPNVDTIHVAEAPPASSLRGKPDAQIKEEIDKAFADKNKQTTAGKAACGKDFYTESGAETCSGVYCEGSTDSNPKICNVAEEKPVCVSGNIVVKVTNSQFIPNISNPTSFLPATGFVAWWAHLIAGSQLWSWTSNSSIENGWTINSNSSPPKIYAVCGDYNINGDVAPSNFNKKNDDAELTQTYNLSYSSQKIDTLGKGCGSNLLGYVIKFKFNERTGTSEEIFAGKNGYSSYGYTGEYMGYADLNFAARNLATGAGLIGTLLPLTSFNGAQQGATEVFGKFLDSYTSRCLKIMKPSIKPLLFQVEDFKKGIILHLDAAIFPDLDRPSEKEICTFRFAKPPDDIDI